MRYNINWHNLQSETPTKDGYYLVNARFDRGASFVAEAFFNASETKGCFTISDYVSKNITAFLVAPNFKRDDLGMKITDWAFLNYPQER